MFRNEALYNRFSFVLKISLMETNKNVRKKFTYIQLKHYGGLLYAFNDKFIIPSQIIPSLLYFKKMWHSIPDRMQSRGA